MLRHLRRVHIQFSPTDPAATAARELLQRVGCRSARASNPDCSVVFNVDENTPAGGAWMELQFTDGETTKLAAADYNADEVMLLIKEKAQQMELKSVLAEVKYDPYKEENRLHSSSGRQQRTTGGPGPPGTGRAGR